MADTFDGSPLPAPYKLCPCRREESYNCCNEPKTEDGMRWCENRDDCKREKLDGKQCGCHLFSRTKTGAPWEHEANPGDKITAIADGKDRRCICVAF
jgi:hypothetical protein